jgi:Arc/MetJ family transcription regulator
MEATISIDEDLLKEGIQITGVQTQRQLVENALRACVAQKKQADIRKYRGKLHWEGNLDEMRESRCLS